RQRLPEARIVALAEAGDVEGADAILRRPLDFHRLNRDLRPLLEGGKGASRVRRVLLVDDDTDVLEVTRKALEAVGCSVTCIADSSEVFRAPPGDGYDLVLLDVVMPEVDGLELCYMLRQHYGEDLRICMITAATCSRTAGPCWPGRARWWTPSTIPPPSASCCRRAVPTIWS